MRVFWHILAVFGIFRSMGAFRLSSNRSKIVTGHVDKECAGHII